MSEWSVDLEDKLLAELAESIRQGPVVEIRGDTGLRLLTEETVGRIKGLKIEVFSNEHPPPHFRVKYQGSTANFTIRECNRMNGSGEILRFEKNIHLWWQTNKQKLIDKWNSSRPTDCPVGEYRA
jgi:hypothetical protein